MKTSTKKSKISSNYKTVLKEIKAAYCEETRNLHFRASKPVSVNEAVEIMSEALEVEDETHQGYNEFSPSLLRKLPADSKIFLAREGSVCIYVVGKIRDLKSLKSDEHDYNMLSEETRIWWD